MSAPESMPADEIDFALYLAAKKRLDDRSLNLRVWEAFRGALPPRWELLDIGCGLGVTLERLLDAGVLDPGSVAHQGMALSYTGIDSNAALAGKAATRLSSLLESRGLVRVDHHATHSDGEPRWIRFTRDHVGGLDLRLHPSDFFEFVGHQRGKRRWNAIVAHAFLDLVDLDEALESLLALGEAGALLYCSLCFDDLTVVEPAIETELDEQILTAYHRHMYRQQWGGGGGEPRTGRRLLTELGARGIEIVEAGPSDWIIVPRQGQYREGERLVLRFLLAHIGRVVSSSGDVPVPVVEDWTETRLRQVDRGKLIYLAHQLDVLARLPG